MLYKYVVQQLSVPELMIPLVICSILAVAVIGYILFLYLFNRGRLEPAELDSLLSNPLEDLQFLAEIGTLLGLFGTVVGIILSFANIMEGGSKSLGSNLSTALYTTAYGMSIAIVSLTARHVLDRMFLSNSGEEQ